MKTLLACLVVGLQAVWVIATAVLQEYHLDTDPVVRLETRPADPRDLLRGDYVILRYQISVVPWGLFDPRPGARPSLGDPVFVVLEKRGEFHQPVRAALQRPTLQPGQVAIRGRVESFQYDPDPATHEPGDVGAHVRYGVERFYVREGTGNAQGRLTVDVAVSASGRPMLKQLYLDGRPYREAVRK